MSAWASLPTLDAGLNAASAVLLLVGWRAIRRRRVSLHRACMLTAFGASVAFLVVYLVHHARAGVTRFSGPPWARPIYLAILATHTPLAALVPVLASATLFHALRGRFQRHVRLARWTLPVWLYVSVTGVLIWLMLYVL
jgi:uncharacterized membrane protein YozB (DUF420 family)